MQVPVVDVSALVGGGEARELDRVARAIDEACRATGFFLIEGHGIDRGSASAARGRVA